MKNILNALFLLIFFIYGSVIYGSPNDLIKHERFISFEQSSVPTYISAQNSNLSVSKDHYKDGSQSLLWAYQQNAILSIKKDLHFEPKDTTGNDTYLSTFTVWVYNPKASDENIEFQFLKNGKVCTSFLFNINYQGWRAVYVAYERDMEGLPVEGMNEIQIKAPQGSSGKLYFDMLLTAARTDQRHHTPDIHQPRVNKQVTDGEIPNHWLTVYANSLITTDTSLYKAAVFPSELDDISQMENRLQELIIRPIKVTDKMIASIESDFNKYNIVVNNGIISGLPLFYIYYIESFERLVPNWEKQYHRDRGQEFREYFTLMLRVANSYVNAKDQKHRDKLQRIFLMMYDHAYDQGVAAGSCMGNFSHYGYSFRHFFTSYFLMKNVLKEHGRLTEATQALQWYAQINEVFIPPTKNGVDMDAFNTFLMGRICSILIMENSPLKTQYIRAFSRWMDFGSRPAPGLDGAFKTDGSAYHHRNNYPAYAVGGLEGLTSMLYLLSRTSFAISGEAHQTVKNVLLTMRFYCNTVHLPLSMSGRHPNGKGELVPIHFARMALSGTPDGSHELDKEMAAAYLRLSANNESSEDLPEYIPKSDSHQNKEMHSLFAKYNILPENNPQGNKAMGYACTSIHRRGNWSAVVRGHSRYLWAAEHYQGANLYGRYLAHGSMQILTADKNKRVTPTTSGWAEEGFDWGRIPGTTTIHLPTEQLEANILNVDKHSGYEEMLFSDEAFAGGLSQNGENGSFAMLLHEHDKYNGSHRARKSFHFLGDKIICLGSDIENQNTDYNTETTIFQLALTDSKGRDYWNSYKPVSEYCIDHLGTGYYVPKKEENNLVLEHNKKQVSRYQNTGEFNSGDWIGLILNHGKAPKRASYEYVVLPQTNIKDKKLINKSYDVIQKDKKAHIVRDNVSNTLSYVFFAPSQSISQSIIQKVDTACLVMMKEIDKNSILLTVANPDLALYRGKADEIYDEQGKRIERSIYSRPWISNECKEVPVTITLRGKWSISEDNKYITVSEKDNTTTLSFKCREAASINVKLKKATK